MTHTMTRQVLNLALANPQNITPSNGKPWQRFIAANIQLIDIYGEVVAPHQFLSLVLDFFEKLKKIDESDFYFFWLGFELHPLLAPAGLGRQLALIDEVVAGRLSGDKEIAEFCAQRGIPNVELMQKKAEALMDFVHFLLRLEEVDVEFLMEMAAEEYCTLSRLTRNQPHFPRFRRH